MPDPYAFKKYNTFSKRIIGLCPRAKFTCKFDEMLKVCINVCLRKNYSHSCFGPIGAKVKTLRPIWKALYWCRSKSYLEDPGFIAL